jgi:hypothetical protein
MYVNFDGTRYEVKRAAIAAASSGNNTLVTAVAGKRIVVVHYQMIAAGTVTAKFQSGAGGTDLSGAMALTTNSGASDRFDRGLFETAAGALLNLSLSGAISVAGYLSYIEV